MIKKIFSLYFCMLGLTLFAATANACDQAPPPGHPAFCSAFKQIAKCQCDSNGGLGDACNDMNILYNGMRDTFGSLEAACAYQTMFSDGTDQGTCINDWNYYRSYC
jgi:hypothetical protein